jgi:hypothetical protein
MSQFAGLTVFATGINMVIQVGDRAQTQIKEVLVAGAAACLGRFVIGEFSGGAIGSGQWRETVSGLNKSAYS